MGPVAGSLVNVWHVQMIESRLIEKYGVRCAFCQESRMDFAAAVISDSIMVYGLHVETWSGDTKANVR